ncbi:GatB/YqeY domain-containing protein [Patescibacteria group bacterium]
MLLQRINEDIKQAMRNKDTQQSSLLRSVVSEINNQAIELKKKEEGLNEQEEIKVLKREVKKRKDSIVQFEAGGRPELAEQEKKELEVLQTYLPEEMNEQEIKKIVEKVINKMGEVAPSQFGEVMKKVIEETQGQADGSLVSQIVKEKIK